MIRDKVKVKVKGLDSGTSPRMTGGLRVLLCLVLVFAFAFAPFAVFAEPEVDADNSVNLTVEYRYSDGEAVEVTNSITQHGRKYHLVSQAAPVLESSLPITRTYTYKIDGLLSEADLETARAIPGLVLSEVLGESEREVDKTVVIPNLPTNDVLQDGIPEYKNFDVTSAASQDGTVNVTLKRAAVKFRVTEESLGLPEEYEATVVYRGLETYEVPYYMADMTYESKQTEGTTDQYVIIAIYEPELIPDESVPNESAPDETVTGETITGETVTGEVVPDEANPDDSDDLTRDDTGTEIDPGLEPEEPSSEFSAEDEAKFAKQTGNPFLDVFRGNVPLGSFFVKGAWSLLSAVITLAAVILAIIQIFGAILRRKNLSSVEVFDESTESKRKKLARIARVVAIILGVAAIVTWIYLEDFSLPMVWVNQWTTIIGSIFIAQVVMLIICAATSAEEDSEKIDFSDSLTG
jgi:hypothetical protein